jgi:hypothetical protein
VPNVEACEVEALLSTSTSPTPIAPITHVCASTPFALALAPLGSLPMKQ